MKFILDKQLISQRDSNMSKRVSRKNKKKLCERYSPSVANGNIYGVIFFIILVCF